MRGARLTHGCVLISALPCPPTFISITLDTSPIPRSPLFFTASLHPRSHIAGLPFHHLSTLIHHTSMNRHPLPPPADGRNSSSAFAISSGTIGATLSSTFSSYPSIALSYGVVTRPVPPHIIHLANDAAVDVCARLWADWGTDTHAQRVLDKGKMGGKVQLYAVNLLLVEEFLKEENRKVMWTRIARNGYGQLFKRKQPYVFPPLLGIPPTSHSQSLFFYGFRRDIEIWEIIHGNKLPLLVQTHRKPLSRTTRIPQVPDRPSPLLPPQPQQQKTHPLHRQLNRRIPRIKMTRNV
jgi:hypothetical protein